MKPTVEQLEMLVAAMTRDPELVIAVRLGFVHNANPTEFERLCQLLHTTPTRKQLSDYLEAIADDAYDGCLFDGIMRPGSDDADYHRLLHALGKLYRHCASYRSALQDGCVIHLNDGTELLWFRGYAYRLNDMTQTDAPVTDQVFRITYQELTIWSKER